MSRDGNTYSRLVVAAKIVLPLGAIGLLSTLFLLARTAPQGEPVRFVDESVSDLADRQRLGSPVHASVTAEGTQVQIIAESMYPDADRPKLTHSIEPVAELLTQDGFAYDITARTGHIDEIAMRSRLQEDVLILTSDGYRIRTDALELHTDLTYLETLAPVSADGPLGTLDAGRMEIHTDPDDETRTRMVFTDGVRLVYTP